MSTPHNPGNQAPKPTAMQLRTLRALALNRGQSFAYPAASREIERLLKAPSTTSTDRLIETWNLDVDVAIPRDAAAVREDEVTGYGAGAQCKRGAR